MSTKVLHVYLGLFFIFSSLISWAQPGQDCLGAEVICSDGAIDFNPLGIGIDDFADPDNDAGCLSSDENQSAWYYFEFQPDMPPNSVIEFTVNPDGGSGEDYDFAIFGPDVECDDLGSPIRCSYASASCALCPQTGLGMGANDTSEPPAGDGFVSSLTVQPGEGYFLLMDNFLGTSTGFSMDWGGSAAPFLNCDAVPGCELVLTVGNDIEECANDNAFSFSLSSNVSGNIDPVSYTWTAVDGTGASVTNLIVDPTSPNPTINLPAGFEGMITFTLVAEELTCVKTETVVFSTFPLVDISGEDFEFCDGGSATLSVVGNFQSYAWSTGESTPTIIVDEDGTYTVTVTDGNNCEGEAVFNIEEYDALNQNIVGENEVCTGLSATFGVEDATYNYTWSTGEFSQYITVTDPGLYSVTIFDINSCIAEIFWNVNSLLDPPFIIDGPAEICENGASNLTVLGSFNSYTWSTGDEGQTTNISSSGTYDVTVVDANGCINTEEIIVEPADTPAPIIIGNTSLCVGDFQVLDAINTNTDNPFIDFLWSDGSPTPYLEVTQGGIYSVTVTGANGCIGSGEIVIEENMPVVTILGDTIFCEGTSVVLEADDTFSSYEWSNGATGESIEIFSPGIYAVTVQDINACTAIDSIEVTLFETPEVTIQGNLEICPSGETTLSTTEIFASYAWSTGSTDAVIPVNSPGEYTVTVIDENSCQAIDAVIVIEENELSITLLGATEICEGEISLLQLAGNYAMYTWSTGENTSTIGVEITGGVSVSVTDEFGCFGEASIDILVNDLPTVTISGNEIFCDSTSSTLNAGSFANYLWQDSSSLSTLEVIETGTYMVTVTDDNGCMNNTSLFVEELALPIPEILGPDQFCPQTITTLMGEDGFISYEWNGGETTQSISTSTIGTYTLTVIDEFGCEGSNDIELINFIVQDPEITGTPIFCPDESTVLSIVQIFENYNWSNDGSAQSVIVETTGNLTVEVTDGNGCITSSDVLVGEYSTSIPNISGPLGLCIGDVTTLTAESGFDNYSWSTDDNTENLVVNAANIYELTVIDTNGCQTENTYELLEYALPVIDILGPNTFCTGFYTTLSSSDAFEEYLWSTGETASSLQVGIAQDYILTVTDENGCQNSNDITIIEASELSPEITGPLFYCKNESTTLDAGFGFFTYTWSDNSSGQILTITEPGTYSVSVTDEGGCAGEFEVLVVENPLPEPIITGTLEFCVDDFTILDVGDFYTTYQWESGEEISTITVNTPGDYEVTVTNQFDCKSSDTVSVVERPLPEFNIIGQDFFCENSATAIGVEPAFSNYEWTNGEDSQVTEISSAGDIGVTATNIFGCEHFEEIAIAEILLPIADAGEDDVLDCEVRMLTLDAGIENNLGYNYTYEWSGNGITANDGTSEFPVIEEEGVYTLIVTDEDHNCESLPVEVIITDLAYQPEIELTVFDTLDCITESVRIEAEVSVGGNNIQYQWLDKNRVPIPGENDDYIIATVAEEYFFELIDELTHCMAEDSAMVVEDNLYPISNAGEPAHLDCITTTVDLDATGSEEGTHITYEWQTVTGNILGNGNSIMPTINSSGIYQLIVSDTLNGCENISEVMVTQDVVLPNVDAGENQLLDCHTETVSLFGESTTANAGISVNFEWYLSTSNTVLSTQNTYEVSQPGTYTLVVTNQINGCVNEDEVIVNLDGNFPTDMNLNFHNPTCAGDANGIVLIENVVGGAQPLVYSLDANPFSGSSNFTNLPAGEYLITVQDANGCEYADEIYLEDGNDLLLDLGDDIYIDLGETADVDAYVNVDPDDLASITWQAPESFDCVDENCLSFSTSPFITTNYVVTVADDNGCIRQEDITIYVNKPRDVFIPNVFSPNGDGTNDVEMIFAGRSVKIIKSFLIFNRWGEPVFEVYNFPPNDPTYGWDGHYKTGLYNSAVFAYFAEIEFIDGEVILYKGDVTLLK